MIIKNKGIKLAGKLQIWQGRLTSYLGMINFIMIFYLYIHQSPLNLEWYHWSLLIISIITTVLFIDIHYIFPSSQEYAFGKNPEMINLKTKINENSNKLDEILERIK